MGLDTPFQTQVQQVLNTNGADARLVAGFNTITRNCRHILTKHEKQFVLITAKVGSHDSKQDVTATLAP